MNTDSKPLRVVAYIRVAREDQLASEQQQAEVQKYADDNGYEIAYHVIDNGVSGLKNKRAVKKILHEAKKYGCNMVVCKEPSRLSRDPGLFMTMLDALNEHNVHMDYVLAPSKENADYIEMLMKSGKKAMK